jgi:hypothetical protein
MVVVLERQRARTRRALVGLFLASHPVRSRRHPDPQPDFERPLAEFRNVLFALQFERADHCRRPRELLERKQPKRVAHQDAHPRRRDPGITKPSQHERERHEPQVRFGLAAAGGKEQQVDDRAGVLGIEIAL